MFPLYLSLEHLTPEELEEIQGICGMDRNLSDTLHVT